MIDIFSFSRKKKFPIVFPVLSVKSDFFPQQHFPIHISNMIPKTKYYSLKNRGIEFISKGSLNTTALIKEY